MFGQLPRGERLARIERSPQYRNGKFHNTQSARSQIIGQLQSSIKFFLGKTIKQKPSDALPAIKTDLNHLEPDEDLLMWFGHSS
jgi:hypothetical protein